MYTMSMHARARASPVETSTKFAAWTFPINLAPQLPPSPRLVIRCKYRFTVARCRALLSAGDFPFSLLMPAESFRDILSRIPPVSGYYASLLSDHTAYALHVRRGRRSRKEISISIWSMERGCGGLCLVSVRVSPPIYCGFLLPIPPHRLRLSLESTKRASFAVAKITRVSGLVVIKPTSTPFAPFFLICCLLSGFCICGTSGFPPES